MISILLSLSDNVLIWVQKFLVFFSYISFSLIKKFLWLENFLGISLVYIITPIALLQMIKLVERI